MILRFVKFGWAVSLVAGLAALLYVYASLPEHVVYSLSDKIIGKAAVEREIFFYVALAILAGVNFLLYALSKNVLYKAPAINTLIRQWQLGLAILLNIFFIIAVNFIQLVNSGESFEFDSFGYLIYVALGLILLWIFALPVLIVTKNKA